MRGVFRERFDVLVAAFRQLPKHLAILSRKYRSGNPELAQWINATRSSGRSIALIVMIERFGDIVACLPIARYLQQRDPDVVIAWVCSARFNGIFINHPWVDRVFNEESLAAWLLAKRRLPAGLPCYELFLDSQRCTWTGLRLPGRHSGINSRNYLSDGRHLLLSYALAAGLSDVPNIQPQLCPFAAAASWRASLGGKPLMAVHFDSEDPDRRLSSDAALAFVDAAIACGWNVIELGLRPLVSERRAGVRFPGHSQPLQEHIAILNECEHFAGAFSGFMVCANALSKPATVFIGTFRNFSGVTPASGEFWKKNWDCVYGSWSASDCPVPIAEKHVPAPPFTAQTLAS